MSTIGERIREERERLKLSQSALAAIGGVGKHSQINYEADRRYPDASYFAHIADAGADVLFILTGRREQAATTTINSVDPERLERAIELVERGIVEGHRDPSPKEKAEMIIAAYELLNEPSDATTRHILRLVVG